MRLYDLCLAWNWEHDADFVRILDSTCAARGLTLLDVSAHNLADVLPLLSRREAGFRLFMDRASEADPAYLPLVDIARSLGARRFNPRELADRAYDKAAMHRTFLEEGIPTPKTLIIPAYNIQTELPLLDLTPLGRSFTVKPALGGGGEGVITDVSTLEQVQIARQQFPEQQYLLQEHVTPKIVNGLPAWFRVIYCLGEIFPCHWDTTTHVYTPLRAEAETRPGLAGPRQVTRRIAEVCKLDLFSTEICLTEEYRLLVVDYVNDPIDLRVQSKAEDGVPDFIIQSIAEKIAGEATESEPRFLDPSRALRGKTGF